MKQVELEALAAPLIEALRRAEGTVLIVTGAGVSAASGIRTFRGSEPDAVWRQHDVALATAEYFERDPVGQLTWYLGRFAAADSASPNPAHEAIAEIERQRAAAGLPFLLVTQNIDTLHERAGSRRMIKVHGSNDRLRCARAGCRFGAPKGSIRRAEVDLGPFRRTPGTSTLPRCPECAAPLRPHVLFFDEYYTDHEDYRYPTVEQAAEEAAVMLFAGTSFAVGVTALLLEAAARRSVPVFGVDPAGSRAPAFARVTGLTTTAEELLPVVAEALRGPGIRPGKTADEGGRD